MKLLLHLVLVFSVCCHDLATIDKAMDAWASQNATTKATLRTLAEKGYTSLAQLRHLSSNDVTTLFQNSELLPPSQRAVLKKALQKLCDSANQEAGGLSKYSAGGNEYRFLLLGKTGSGKSTTGNTILGAELFSVGNSFESVTNECELRSNTNLGRNMEIMDTPGLFDTKRTQEEIAIDILKSVAAMHPGPHAVIYVIPVGRYTEEEFNVYERLKALFDQDLLRYMVIVFTRGHSLRPGETIEKLLEKVPESLKKVLEECGQRYVLFNNYAADTTPYVQRLLSVVDTMNHENNGVPYSCPKYSEVGKVLEEEVNRRMAKLRKGDLEKEVQQLREDMQRMQREQDEEKRKEAEKKVQELQIMFKEELRERDREMRKLKDSIAHSEDGGIMDALARVWNQIKRKLGF